MKFGNKIRSTLNAFLEKDAERFIVSSLSFLETNFEGYHKVCFESVNSKESPFSIRRSSCVDFIIQAKENKAGVVLGLKNGGGGAWHSNEILFQFTLDMPRKPLYGTPEHLAYLEWRNNLEYKCEFLFWGLVDKQLGYQEFDKINIFDNQVFDEERLAFYQRKFKFLFNQQVWLDFVNSLIIKMFPKYRYNLNFSTKKIRRHLFEIKEGIWFGFEFDTTEMKHQLKNRGTASLPDAFNLILIDESTFNKYESTQNYYCKENESIISLGLLGNPFFFPPCYPLSGFSAVDTNRLSTTSMRYASEIYAVGNGMYQFVNSAAYGDSMKRHAYFYMNLLASTSEVYLDYLERVIQESLDSCLK